MAAPSVVIIEQDPDYLEPLDRLLRERGVSVWTAREGKDGLQIIVEHPPELIILAVKLPNVSGYKICKKLKTHSRFQDTPLFLLAGPEERDTLELHRKLKTRAEEYFIKPFSPRELRDKAMEYLLGEQPDGFFPEPSSLDGALLDDEGAAPRSVMPLPPPSADAFDEEPEVEVEPPAQHLGFKSFEGSRHLAVTSPRVLAPPAPIAPAPRAFVPPAPPHSEPAPPSSAAAPHPFEDLPLDDMLEALDAQRAAPFEDLDDEPMPLSTPPAFPAPMLGQGPSKPNAPPAPMLGQATRPAGLPLGAPPVPAPRLPSSAPSTPLGAPLSSLTMMGAPGVVEPLQDPAASGAYPQLSRSAKAADPQKRPSAPDSGAEGEGLAARLARRDQQIKELRERQEQLLGENAGLQEALLHARDEQAKLHQDAHLARQRTIDARQAQEEAQDQIEELGDALRQERAASSQAHARAATLEELLEQAQEALRAQDARTLSLVQELARAREGAQQAQEAAQQAQEEARRAQRAAQQAQEDAQQAQEDAQQAQEEAHQARAEARRAGEDAEQAREAQAQLQQELDEARGAEHGEQRRSAEQEQQLARAKVALQQARDHLRAVISKAESDMKELREEYAKARQQWKQEQAIMAEEQRRLSDLVKDLEGRADDLSHQLDEKSQEYDLLREEHQDLWKTLQASEEDIGRLTRELAQTRQELEQARVQHQELSLAKQQEEQHARRLLEEAQGRESRLTQVCAQHEQHIASMEQALGELERVNQTTRTNLQKATLYASGLEDRLRHVGDAFGKLGQLLAASSENLVASQDFLSIPAVPSYSSIPALPARPARPEPLPEPEPAEASLAADAPQGALSGAEGSLSGSDGSLSGSDGSLSGSEGLLSGSGEAGVPEEEVGAAPLDGSLDGLPFAAAPVVSAEDGEVEEVEEARVEALELDGFDELEDFEGGAEQPVVEGAEEGAEQPVVDGDQTKLGPDAIPPEAVGPGADEKVALPPSLAISAVDDGEDDPFADLAQDLVDDLESSADFEMEMRRISAPKGEPGAEELDAIPLATPLEQGSSSSIANMQQHDDPTFFSEKGPTPAPAAARGEDEVLLDLEGDDELPLVDDHAASAEEMIELEDDAPLP